MNIPGRGSFIEYIIERWKSHIRFEATEKLLEETEKLNKLLDGIHALYEEMLPGLRSLTSFNEKVKELTHRQFRQREARYQAAITDMRKTILAYREALGKKLPEDTMFP